MSSQQPCILSSLIDRAKLLRGDAITRPPFEPRSSIHVMGRNIGLNVHNIPDAPLEIRLTTAGEIALRSLVRDVVELSYPNQADGHRVETITEFKADHPTIWGKLFDGGRGNPLRSIGQFELLNPASADYSIIGTNTKSPIVAENVRRNEAGEIRSATRLWYFPTYEIESELEALLHFGRVEFKAVWRKDNREFRAC